jgi:hypothetical protein
MPPSFATGLSGRQSMVRPDSQVTRDEFMLREKIGDRHSLAIPNGFLFFCLNLSDSGL